MKLPKSTGAGIYGIHSGLVLYQSIVKGAIMRHEKQPPRVKHIRKLLQGFTLLRSCPVIVIM